MFAAPVKCAEDIGDIKTGGKTQEISRLDHGHKLLARDFQEPVFATYQVGVYSEIPIRQ